MYKSAFTRKYSTVVNALKSDIVIKANGKELTVIGLWDTGATNSCISKNVEDRLGLISTGKTLVNTASETQDERDTYLVDVVLPNNLEINDLMVIDSEIGKQKIGMLIGMDIITRGDFSITHSNGKTKLSFGIPSEKNIDYVRDIRISNVIKKPKGKSKSKNKRKKK